MVQSSREPRRSESAPAIGAMTMMITESATMIHPTCDGVYPSRFWRKNGSKCQHFFWEFQTPLLQFV